MTIESVAQRAPLALWLIVPALLFVCIYGRSLDYDFVWTDQGEIELGFLILPPGEIHTAFGRPMLSGLPEDLAALSVPYYRPLQVIAASVIDDHFGRQPRNFRSLNLFLGCLTSIAIAWLGWLLFDDRSAALIAGSLYAVHPANIENYVWIAGLSHSLAAFFIALSLGFGVLSVRRAKGWIPYAILSLVSLLLALASKENAAVTPLLQAACGVALGVREARRAAAGQAEPDPMARGRAAAIATAQLAIVLAFVFLWRPHVLGGVLAESGPLMGSLRVQIVTAVASWTGAMSWLLLPFETTTSDVVRLVGSPFEPAFLVGAGVALGSLVLALRLLRGGRELAALGLIWIWIAFAPTSGLVPLNHMRGERYLSLSLFGLALLVPALVLWAREAAPDRVRRNASVAIVLVLLAFYAERSWQRIPDWRSNLALFSADVATSPLYREGHHELAKARVEAGDFDGAKQALDTLSDIGDSFRGNTSFLRIADAIELHCVVNLNLGRASDSMRYFERLSLEPADLQQLPTLSLCAARTLEQVGDPGRARRVYEALYALGPSPWRAETIVAIARIEFDADRVAEARRWLERVRREEIRNPEVLARYTVLRAEIDAGSRER